MRPYWWALIHWWALIVGSILVHSQIVPIVGRPEQSRCFERPIACSLSCVYGYRRNELGTCLCICADSPCATTKCSDNQICVVQGGKPLCVAGEGVRTEKDLLPHREQCPRLTGGICALKCEKDEDCTGRLICCHNGCGRECVAPLLPFPIRTTPIEQVHHEVSNGIHIQPIGRIGNRNSFPITVDQEEDRGTVPESIPIKRPKENEHKSKAIPIQRVIAVPVESREEKEKISIKPGECPSNTVLERNCTSECRIDSDCDGHSKCCRTLCGHVCTQPTKTTGCIHLVSAVLRLPSGTLSRQYLPNCTVSGSFEKIQCDETQCWCSDPDNGSQIPGTRRPKGLHSMLMCFSPRSCEVSCSNKCPHGHKMDKDGCPMQNCECKNICENVRCRNNGDECQLVEPECAVPPCLPVPRCLLNPCPSGPPMTLLNGVTALCTNTTHCSDRHWCNLVGYNGLGFCCAGTAPNIREGACPSRQPIRREERCQSECNTDDDCKSGKCCFDGCSLRCTPISFLPHPLSNRKGVEMGFTPGTITRQNKALLSPLVFHCPSVTLSSSLPIRGCPSECVRDAECEGMRICCDSDCGRKCVHAEIATACFHHAISMELYSLRSVRKCTSEGLFERKQCGDEGCFCVDQTNGREIVGTRRTQREETNCEPDLSLCRLSECRVPCPFGYSLSTNGCPTCLCTNPCQDVKCPQGTFCQMVQVRCTGNGECPQQPRCILNTCPLGDPFISSAGFIESCGIGIGECPRHFWCHRTGLTTGGVCCPAPKPEIRKGECSTVVPVLNTRDKELCKKECRSDEDCQTGRKCCSNGCGLSCVSVPESISSSNLHSPTEFEEKPGECPTVDEGRECAKISIDLCLSDSSCPGVQKCCNDGCRRSCLYPVHSSLCIQLKGALQRIGQKDAVNCTKDGQFDTIQCDSSFCWCVSENGKELKGTRVSTPLTPNCSVRRECLPVNCPSPVNCPNGVQLDSNGCETCECADPCKSITCPLSTFCLPSLSDCPSPPCPILPKCITNPCPIGIPLKDTVSYSPIDCTENNQCRDTSTPSYCRVYTSEGGYCCPAPEPRSSFGSCPTVSLSTDCTRHCVLDDSCAENEKCCFNGCGMSCTPAVHSPSLSSNLKIGSCLPLDVNKELCSIDREQHEDSCVVNEECPHSLLCCPIGCGRRVCTHPDHSSPCLHSRLSSLSLRLFNPSLYIPSCDSEGNFHQIQSFKGEKWCVDERGIEVPGTRTTRVVNCRQPRSCRVVSCTKECPAGFSTDSDGCELCECIKPCRGIICRQGHVCRLLSTTCVGTKDCPPVAECIPNGCPSPSSSPLSHPSNGLLMECDLSNPCPMGHFCRRTGFEGRGYCCAGKDPSPSTPSCPSLPLVNSTDANGRSCDVQCSSSLDCRSSLCCFNGCGITCLYTWNGHTKPTSLSSLSTISTSPPIHPVSSLSTDGSVTRVPVRVDNTEEQTAHSIKPAEVTRSFGKVGECGLETLPNPGCTTNCMRDTDCEGFEKCCVVGCGRMCSIPSLLPICVRLLLSFDHTLSRLGNPLPPPIQCTPEGEWREVQCDIRTRECWCINTKTGIEIWGTRVTSSGPLPNCKAPRPCPHSCPPSSSCPSGYQLDTIGCPLSPCQCSSPCDKMDCSLPGEVCVLTTKQCLDGPCSGIPKCVKLSCPPSSFPLLSFHSPLLCSPSDGCAQGECIQISGEDNLGMCCQKGEVQSSSLQIVNGGSCPKHDYVEEDCRVECNLSSPCTGLLKCCQYGCSALCMAPVNSTNCVNTRSALESLHRSGISIDSGRMPSCEPGTGLFSRVQCNSDGVCWCVNPSTGIEIHGTRRKPLAGVDVCLVPRSICAHHCPSLCPFGLRIDPFGCPMKSCECIDPCQGIHCRNGELCLLRPRPCTSSSSACLPIPTCSANPCSSSLHPSVDSRTHVHFTCSSDSSSICPTGFYCSGVDQYDTGVCCPAQEPSLSPPSPSICPHGDPFSSSIDGTPLECTVSLNGCPSSHYCSTPPLKSKGICCVSKRHVCNLSASPGPCTLSVPRFHYLADNQSCVPFEYGGCSGNMNNFATLEHCQKFCQGVGFNLDTPLLSDDGRPTELYEMGFLMKGPWINAKERREMHESLHDYLLSRFSLHDSELRDLVIKEDNSVHFTIQSPDAEKKAQEIHGTVVSRSLRFPFSGTVFIAEPQTWFAQHVAEQSVTSAHEKFVFWAIFTAGGVLCATVFAVLCCACSFLLRNRDKSPSRDSSPSNLRSHSFSAEDMTRRRVILPSHLSSTTTVRLPSDATVHSRYNGRQGQSPTTLYY